MGKADTNTFQSRQTSRLLKGERLWYWLKHSVRSKGRRLSGHRYTWNPKFGEVAAIPKMIGSIPYPISYLGGKGFCFQNREYHFPEFIDWNYLGHGKWWNYQLNAFDYLNQPGLPADVGFKLIELFLDNRDKRAAEEPYPMAQRLFNWIKFIAREKHTNSKIESALHAQLDMLNDQLELHLDSHLVLEESLALVLCSWYLRRKDIYEKAFKTASTCLQQQILKDGGHFERSPMYHQLILFRLLDLVNVLMHNPWPDADPLNFFAGYSKKMLGWLQQMTFENGSIPLFQDCANGLAPASLSLLYYAGRLGIIGDQLSFGESNYRRFNRKSFQMVIDLGPIGSRNTPRHQHCNTLGIVLFAHDFPCLVDTGTSTLEDEEIRLKERSTSAHNTVQYGEEEQSELKNPLQMGKMALSKILIDEPDRLEAEHDGYKRKGIIHRRRLDVGSDQIRIVDSLIGKTSALGFAHFHFAPGIQPHLQGAQVIAGDVTFLFNGQESLSIKSYNHAAEFNRSMEAQKIVVTFRKSIETTIHFK